jgi:hypothetical protein
MREPVRFESVEPTGSGIREPNGSEKKDMADFTVKSDSVDVEQIMRQVRSRIREKRGVDYTEDEIRELATVKLERFLDPKGVRSDLLEQYRKRRNASTTARNYSFEDTTLYESSRPLVRGIRKLLNPILKLFFNPTPVVEALHIQSKLNDTYNQAESLYYELIHNLVLETTRLGIEVKNLKMRVESMSSRLDFDERRARALEGVVQYRPGTVAPLQPPAGGSGGGVNATISADEAERRSRRRRRRGRRRPGGPGQGPSGDRQGQPGTAGHDSGRADAGESSGPPGETGNGPAES